MIKSQTRPADMITCSTVMGFDTRTCCCYQPKKQYSYAWLVHATSFSILSSIAMKCDTPVVTS